MLVNLAATTVTVRSEQEPFGRVLATYLAGELLYDLGDVVCP